MALVVIPKAAARQHEFAARHALTRGIGALSAASVSLPGLGAGVRPFSADTHAFLQQKVEIPGFCDQEFPHIIENS